MSRINRQETIEYYRRHLAEHGPGPKGMDWRDEETQFLRFEVICRYLDLSDHPSVLDVGCGSGEFYAYVQDRGDSIDYTGADLCPEMVTACQARFGEQSARLLDAADLPSLGDRFDYVIASGTFNAKLDADESSWREDVHSCLCGMFQACRIAIVVNFMTSFVDYRYDRLYYPTAQELTTLAVEHMSRQYVIDHSYPLYEQTLAVFRKPAAGASVD